MLYGVDAIGLALLALLLSYVTEEGPMKTEPAVIVGLIQALIITVVALVTAFGVDLTEGQTSAILGASAAALALILALVTRSKVTPTGE